MYRVSLFYMSPLCTYATRCVLGKTASAIHVVTREKSPLGSRIEFSCGHVLSSTPSQASAMYQSVLQRVSSMPELLDIIFDHLDPTSNVNNVVVCKGWSEVARDKLWREVHCPRRLLSILAPISVLTGVSGVATIRVRLLIVLFRTLRGNSNRKTGLVL